MRKLLAREPRAAGRGAGRRGRLRAAVRQAAVPRGRVATAGTTGCARSSTSWARRSSAGCGWGSASRGAAPSTTCSRKFAADERARLPILLDAAADAVEAWAREGTSKAANRFNAFELQAPAAPARRCGRAPKPGEVGGPADDARRAPDEDGLAPDPRRRRRAGEAGRDGRRARGRRPAVTDRYRGRTTRERKLADKVAREWAERRAAAEVDRARGRPRPRVGRGRGGAARPGGAAGASAAARPPARGAAAPRRRRRRGASDRGRAARGAPAGACPDLAALPRLLHETGSFATLRERLGRGAAPGDARPPRRADDGPARGEVVPRRGARAGRRAASGSAGWPGTRRSATAWPRSWGRGWATRRWSRCWSRGPRSRTSARSWSPTRRPRGSRRWRRGATARRRSSSPASRRCSRRRSRRTTCPRRIRTLRPGTRDRPGRAAGRALRPRLHARPRGRGPRRVRPARRHRGRVPAVGARCRSGSSCSATRSTRCAPSTRPTSGAWGRSSEVALLPGDGVPAARRAARTRSGRGSGGWRRGCRSAWRWTSRGSPARRRPSGPRPSPAGRALPAGDAAEVWSRLVAPSTGLDHLDPTTLFVLDEPGDLADAADFLWRQAEERHGELVEQGELPRDWPAAYLPPRDWKARLHGARTLELTWQSEAGEADGMAFASKGLTSGDLFGWREPVLPPGRTERAGRRRRALAGRAGPRRARVRPGAAPRGAPGRGRPRRRHRQPRRRGAAARGHRAGRAQPQRRLRGRPGRAGGGHRPRAVRHACGSAGRRRCGASSRATSSSA